MRSEEEIQKASGLTNWQWHYLKKRYTWPEKERHYHVFDHALDVANCVLDVKGQWNNSAAALLAGLYHDVDYVPGSPNNEMDSASFLLHQLRGSFGGDGGFSRSTIYRAQTLIVATAHHFSLEPELVSHDEALFLDCDLAGYAKPYKDFKELQEKVDSEFLPLCKNDKDLLSKRRLKFFNTVLSSESIYMTDYMRNQFEARARCNIKKYLSEVYGS